MKASSLKNKIVLSGMTLNQYNSLFYDILKKGYVIDDKMETHGVVHIKNAYEKAVGCFLTSKITFFHPVDEGLVNVIAKTTRSLRSCSV